MGQTLGKRIDLLFKTLMGHDPVYQSYTRRFFGIDRVSCKHQLLGLCDTDAKWEKIVLTPIRGKPNPGERYEKFGPFRCDQDIGCEGETDTRPCRNSIDGCNNRLFQFYHGLDQPLPLLEPDSSGHRSHIFHGAEIASGTKGHTCACQYYHINRIVISQRCQNL